jgi:hypothetical protein
MKDHIQDLDEWPTPGPNRWLNTYHMLYQRYLELDDPAISLPKEPLIVVDLRDPKGMDKCDARWREHIGWAKANGIADQVLTMLKRSPSVLDPASMETFQLRPWAGSQIV